MAAHVLSPRSAINPQLGVPGVVPKSSFLSGTDKLIFAPVAQFRRKPLRKCYRPPSAYFSDVPKQFREESLVDGLMENYKTVPQSFYGLTEREMAMFMTEDSPVSRTANQIDEEHLSASWSYEKSSGKQDVLNHVKYSTSMSMLTNMAGRRPREAPPDLPSLLLDARIVYLGMPIVPEVTELIVAQLMWLDYDDCNKPIYIYINSTGTHDEDKQLVGSETDAFAIADAMDMCTAPIYTVNLSVAYGEAAMILARGKKGYRALQPHSIVRIYLPHVHQSNGSSSDMWIKAKELEANSSTYLRLLAEGIGKPKEQLAHEIQFNRFFLPEKAIEFGIADRIMETIDGEAADRKDYRAMAAQNKAMRVARMRGGSQPAPSDNSSPWS